MSELVIPFPDENNSPWGPLFIGQRQRLSTMTAVKLLDETTLLACSLVARRLYVVHFDMAAMTSEIISESCVTEYAGVPTSADLIDVRGDRIATSNLHADSVSLYRRSGDRVVLTGAFPIDTGALAHGVCFYNDEIVAVTFQYQRPGVHFFRLDPFMHLLYVPTPPHIRDVGFVGDNEMLLVYGDGGPGNHPSSYPSYLARFTFDIAKGISETTAVARFEDAHFDSLATWNGRVYIADQHRDCIRVVDSSTLQQLNTRQGYSFPHGVDANFGLLAVASYGDNTVKIREL